MFESQHLILGYLKYFLCFNSFTVESFPETGPFTHVSNHILQSQYCHKYYGAHFLAKMLKINADPKNAIKSAQKSFRINIIAFKM